MRLLLQNNDGTILREVPDVEDADLVRLPYLIRLLAITERAIAAAHAASGGKNDRS